MTRHIKRPALPLAIKEHLNAVAKLEIQEWKGIPRAEVVAMLFAFIHRVVEGETVEETFFKKTTSTYQDYQI